MAAASAVALPEKLKSVGAVTAATTMRNTPRSDLALSGTVEPPSKKRKLAPQESIPAQSSPSASTSPAPSSAKISTKPPTPAFLPPVFPQLKFAPSSTIPSFPLPDLPPLTDPLLAQHAVTHVSRSSSRKHPFEEPSDRFREDYEKLAMVGDAFLKDSLAVLVNKMYPRLAVGSFTAVMSLLLSNEILAQLSARYGIIPRVLTAQAAYAVVIEQTVNGGAMFEAHVDESPAGKPMQSPADLAFCASPRALRYDESETGTPLGERTWKTSRKRDAAVRSWLENLFRPLVKWRYAEEKRLSQPSWTASENVAGPSDPVVATAVPETSAHDNPYPAQPYVDPALIPGALAWLESWIRRPTAVNGPLKTLFQHESAGPSSRAWHHGILQVVNVETGEVRVEGRATGRRLKDAKNEAAARIRQRFNAGEISL